MDTRDVHTSTGTQQAALVFPALDLLTPGRVPPPLQEAPRSCLQPAAISSRLKITF